MNLLFCAKYSFYTFMIVVTFYIGPRLELIIVVINCRKKTTNLFIFLMKSLTKGIICTESKVQRVFRHISKFIGVFRSD